MEQNDLGARWQELNQRIIACRKCPRLVAYREEVGRVKRKAYADWDYWAKPVPGFGDPHARVLVVGLAPGPHGSNRTGRMFTGDSSGNFLYRALYRAGFANQPVSTHRGDGLQLFGIFISAVNRCVPPDNRPTPEEMLNCRPYLLEEMELLGPLRVIVALGQIGFDNVVKIYRQRGLEIPRYKFAHGAEYRVGENLPWLICSYHPSQQNTQTGKLNEAMFDQIWARARELAG